MRRPRGPVYLLGRAGTPGAAETRQFLSRNAVAFRWVDVDDDPLLHLLDAEILDGSWTFPSIEEI